ncbi:sporulation transcriptional regulator SpoIIID [Bacillus cytotoxicus]|uniref:Sporulation stage III transcriptional regulator SpoIIID n=1 Tax=Bacillus cytotoxicus (strain DSM 22905 / CIP 110041 / 391-98 / NVH 391-98) TaxID=315749 RepID=A7GV31_BACCN|nr:Sporulation stage III transcriptional regulator SpoIIID [Bacillus cytotoxicus NVH 391-98]AWC30563.1 sporulation transcriptional regulator SpoIIID [Bacillus cytotoxicus]AWC34619.1 sporulation transcriptional regulator SpoIIID [Bacillus cytotoxicus]AWC38615.1 sporulation transcriptional regulator SpoIIID [Bacillus cytotoxicus]AWC42706.1 sporulation transcriptional regulator SpoIIID [Bacillus cytotoxicus]
MRHFSINPRIFNAYKQHSNLLLSRMQRVSFHASHIQFREASGVHDYIKERTIKIGKYIVETRKTVRVIAKEFGVSKSTVHKDLTERLPEINPELANEVKEILDYHKSIRHLRGGEATKQKYRKEDTERTVQQ